MDLRNTVGLQVSARSLAPRKEIQRDMGSNSMSSKLQPQRINAGPGVQYGIERKSLSALQIRREEFWQTGW